MKYSIIPVLQEDISDFGVKYVSFELILGGLLGLSASIYTLIFLPHFWLLLILALFYLAFAINCFALFFFLKKGSAVSAVKSETFSKNRLEKRRRVVAFTLLLIPGALYLYYFLSKRH